MKKINILIDSTGSMQLNEINKILLCIKNVEYAQGNDITLSFYSDNKIQLITNFKDLVLPILNNLPGCGGGGQNLIEEQLFNQPDELIYISDFYESPIEKMKKSIADKKTKYIFINTTDEPCNTEKFIKNVRNILNQPILTTVDEYTDFLNKYLYYKDLDKRLPHKDNNNKNKKKI